MPAETRCHEDEKIVGSAKRVTRLIDQDVAQVHFADLHIAVGLKRLIRHTLLHQGGPIWAVVRLQCYLTEDVPSTSPRNPPHPADRSQATIRLFKRKLAAQFLQVLLDTIRQVLQGRRWALAFDEDGIGQGQARLSKYILRQLQLREPPAVPAVAPSEEVLKLCYPTGAKVPCQVLLRPFRLPAYVALPAPAVARPLALPVGRPLLPRRLAPLALAPAAAPRPGPQTRSQSRLVAALAKGRPLPRPVAVMRARSV